MPLCSALSPFSSDHSSVRLSVRIVMYKTIFVINIIIHVCLQHSNTLWI